MRVSLLLVSSVLLISVMETYSMPIEISDSGIMKSLNMEIVTKIFTKKVPKSRLTDIISELIGVDLVMLSDQAITTIEKFPQTLETFQDRFQKILSQSSVEFQTEVAKITLNAITRFVVASRKLEGTVSNSEIEIVKSLNVLLEELYKLKGSETVTKEEVVAIFENFLNTKLEGTIRDHFTDFKMNLELFFIVDEINLSLRAAVQKEGPEKAKELSDFIDDIVTELRGMVRPFLDLIKPAVLVDQSEE